MPTKLSSFSLLEVRRRGWTSQSNFIRRVAMLPPISEEPSDTCKDTRNSNMETSSVTKSPNLQPLSRLSVDVHLLDQESFRGMPPLTFNGADNRSLVTHQLKVDRTTGRRVSVLNDEFMQAVKTTVSGIDDSDSVEESAGGDTVSRVSSFTYRPNTGDAGPLSRLFWHSPCPLCQMKGVKVKL
jgi:hypothetical protein